MYVCIVAHHALHRMTHRCNAHHSRTIAPNQALVIYAAVLRRQAARTLAALVKPPADWAEVCPEGPDMVHGASAKLLRRAAGAYAEAATRARAIADRLPSERCGGWVKRCMCCRLATTPSSCPHGCSFLVMAVLSWS